MTATSSPTLSIADFWREARAWLADALNEFRGPAAIATMLAREARAAIRRRLLLIESLVMKLLLIEAASHPFPDRRAAPGPGPIRTIARKRGAANAAHRLHPNTSMGPGLAATRRPGDGWSEDPSDPSTWRVRFRLRIPRGPQQDARASVWPTPLTLRPRAASIRAQAHALRLARRFEALRRVLADPRRAIARLARTLAALAGAAREVAARIALARPPRLERLGSVLAHAMIAGHDASFSFPSDTS